MTSNKRNTIFPGSDPDELVSYSHPHQANNPPLPKGTVRGYAANERPTTQTNRPKPTSNGLPSKHPDRHTLSKSSPASVSSRTLATQPLKDGLKSYLPVSSSKEQGTVSRRMRTPKVTYHEFMNLDQAGAASIGCDNTTECNLVAIKRLSGIRDSSARKIRVFTSDFVVSIKSSYFENDELVIIYERMDVSLRQVTSILQYTLIKPSWIAAICKQLVLGLSYIHKELSICCGELSCGTILLNMDGMVKIGNIGKSFVRNIYTTEEKREDIRSLGFVMMELMEPMTYMLNPQSTELRKPERWNDDSGITDFLSATQHGSLELLQEHDFLPKGPLSKDLKVYVLCAINGAGTDWDILTLP